MPGSPPPALLLLADMDEVGVATRDLQPGERIALGHVEITVRQPVRLGHKVAVKPITVGQKVHKYRVPIGTATEEISAGQHVHTHNLRSDYIPTWTLEPGHQFREDQ
jgi:hypothetical protein